MRMLMVAPLAEEKQLLVESFRRRGAEAESRTVGPIAVHEMDSLDLILAHGGHGKTQFGVQTRYLLDMLPSVEQVICVGAAGGLATGVAIGDPIVALVTHEHDYMVKFVQRPQPRFSGNAEMLEQLRLLPPPAGYQVHYGTVASGDEDVVDHERGRALHGQTGALAVAWEGAGGARACELTGIPFVEIRGATDSADADAASDFETNLALAIDNIADLVWRWLQK